MLEAKGMPRFAELSDAELTRPTSF